MSAAEVLSNQRPWWIAVGDALEQLRLLPDGCVQCCVTSPPYFGLRDYGVAGQIGLEPTLDAYVAALVRVFAEVRRVLHPSGTLWLNLGDSYGSGEIGRHDSVQGRTIQGRPMTAKFSAREQRPRSTGMKPKDLLGVPWAVAFALRDAGWWIRSAITWVKTACMPESVTDRPTSATEMIFLLSRAERYYYDAEAVREQNQGGLPWGRGDVASRKHAGENGHGAGRLGATSMLNSASYEQEVAYRTQGRNLRNAWILGPEPLTENHYAAFPSEIPRRAILAGSRVGDVVLDPFAGSGTTVLVAQRLGRRALGIELSPTYAAMARRRIVADQGVLPAHAAEVAHPAQLRLEEAGR